MHIRWPPAPAADLQDISTYLKDRHLRHQQPTMRKLYETVQSLKEGPRRGCLGREDGTREWLPAIEKAKDGAPDILVVE